MKDIDGRESNSGGDDITLYTGNMNVVLPSPPKQMRKSTSDEPASKRVKCAGAKIKEVF